MTEQKKQSDIENLVDDVVKDQTLTNDYWWEEDFFRQDDEQSTIDTTKTIVDNIKTNDRDLEALLDNILRNLKPVDDRSIQQLIDDDFIPIDDRTLQQRENDDDITLADYDDIIDTTSAWDENKTEIAKPGPIYKISTDYNKKVKAANKIKNKYFKKKIGQRNTKNKVSAEWLKSAGFLDTKDQDAINYVFLPPKKEAATNDIRTEIENTDFKKENLAWKKPADETMKILDDIDVLEPGKNTNYS